LRFLLQRGPGLGGPSAVATAAGQQLTPATTAAQVTESQISLSTATTSTGVTTTRVWVPGEDLDRMWSMDISKEAKDTLVENMYLIIEIIYTERFGVCRVHESLIYSQAQQSSILFLTA
jgi:hypothetical protein